MTLRRSAQSINHLVTEERERVIIIFPERIISWLIKAFPLFARQKLYTALVDWHGKKENF